MELTAHTILITGGASGIGYAFAERFLRAGNEVVICGRREDKLREAQGKLPGIAIRVCDLEDEEQRAALAQWAVQTHPRLDVLVNNAGTQRHFRVSHDARWSPIHQEIAINLEAQIHLTMLLIPHLSQQSHPAIVNITSGLAFVPLVSAPVYSATKAALHSFTLSLRHQLAVTPIEVIEIIPPALNTDLGGPGLHSFAPPVEEFMDAAMTQLAAGSREVSYGFSAQSSRASREELDGMLERLNQPHH